MGILSFFKRARSSLPCIEHPIFGLMDATIVNKDGSLFWETRNSFPTSKGPISVFLDGDAKGPSEAQVVLWQWVYDNMEHLTKAAEPLLLDRLKDFKQEEHIGDLTWISVGLSPDGNKSGPWDLSFELPTKRGAILTVYFENEVPTGVSVDD
jgi:hypothetical protein